MRHRLALLLFFLPIAISAAPSGDGIFAVFETNRGSFTCELFAEKAPVTVANFVGLVEGSRPWIDLPTGRLEQRPFYDGLTFHRIIDGFMIQGGSPNGQGTDGPGYRFRDEFHPDLIHDRAGMLSMANSGPDTNGSQFFITDGPTPWLDYKHAVFGRVIEGMAVVEAIGATATDAGDKPLVPVVMESVTILRNGAAAQSFGVDRDELPRLRELRSQLSLDEGAFLLRAPYVSGADLFLSYSMDLQTWTRVGLPPYISGDPAKVTFDLGGLAGGEESQFYRLAMVDPTGMPEPYVPGNLVGKRLTFDPITHAFGFVLRPDAERTDDPDQGVWLGTGDLDSNTDLGLNYVWARDRSRGALSFILEGFVQFDLVLSFRGATGGTFTGTIRTQPVSSIRGTFTFEDR